MSCKVNFLKENNISNDEFYQILLFENIYDDYIKNYNVFDGENGEGLTDFQNKYLKKEDIDRYKTYVNDLRETIKTGVVKPRSKDFLDFVLNNNLFRPFLDELEGHFVDYYFKTVSSKYNFSIFSKELDALNYANFGKLSKSEFKNKNILYDFLNGVVGVTQNKLESAIKNETDEGRKNALRIRLYFIKSLGLNFSENADKFTTDNNLKENSNLNLLLKTLLQSFPIKIDEKFNFENDTENEDGVRIYEQNPVTSDPFEKLSPFLKMIMAKVEKTKYDGKTIYWNESEFASLLLSEFHGNDFRVTNFPDKFNKFKEKVYNKLMLKEFENDPKYLALKTFIDRVEILKEIKNNGPNAGSLDAKLHLWFQQIPINFRYIKNSKFTVDEKGNEVRNVTVVNDEGKNGSKNFQTKKSEFKDYLYNKLNGEELSQNLLERTTLDFFKINGITIKNEDLERNIKAELKKLKNNIGNEDFFIKLSDALIRNGTILFDDFQHRTINATGEAIYPVIKPSHLTNTVSLINAILEGNESDREEFDRIFKNSFLRNSFFRYYVESNEVPLRISMNNGLNLETKNSKLNYKNFKSDELISFLLNTFLNVTAGTTHLGKLNEKTIFLNLLSSIPADAQNMFSIDVQGDLDIFFKEVRKDIRNTIFGEGIGNIEGLGYQDYLTLSLIKTDIELFEDYSKSEGGVSPIIKKFFKDKNGVEKERLVLTNFKDSDKVIGLFKHLRNNVRDNVENTQEDVNELIKLVKEANEKMVLEDLAILEKAGVIRQPDAKDKTINKVYFLNQDSNLFSQVIKTNSADVKDNFTTDLKKALLFYHYFTTQVDLISIGHPAFYKPKDKPKRAKSSQSNTTRPNLQAFDNVDNKDVKIPEKIKTVVVKDFEEYLDPDTDFGKHSLDTLFETYDKNNFDKKGDKNYERDKEKFVVGQMSNLFSNTTNNKGEPVYALPKNIDEKTGKPIDDDVITSKSTLTNTSDGADIVSPLLKQYLNIAFNENSEEKKQFFLAEKKGGRNRNVPNGNNNTVVKNFVFTHHKPSDIGSVNPMIIKTSQSNYDGTLVFLNGKINYKYAAIGKLFGYKFNFDNKTFEYNPNDAVADQIVFESTMKATIPNKPNGESIVVDLNQIDKSSFDTVTDLTTDSILEIDFWDNTKQQETPEHLEGKSDAGTQLMKLVYNAVDPTGTYVINGKTMTGREVVKEINDVFIELGNRKFQKFNNSILDTNNFFMKLLIELYDSRDVLDPKTLNEDKIQQLLKNPAYAQELLPKVMAKIKKDVAKVQLKTFSLYNGVIPGDDTLQINVDKEGRVIFDIAMPLTNSELYNLLLEKDGSINIDKKDRNGKLIYPEELRERVVYRIPTEAIYSTFVVRVKNFLHPTAGAIAYMPKGTTTMAGFDMDIDKLFGVMKSYKLVKNAKGETIGIDYKDYTNEESNFNLYFWNNLSEEDSNKIYQMKSTNKEIQTEIDELKQRKKDVEERINLKVDKKRIELNNLNLDFKKELLNKLKEEDVEFNEINERLRVLFEDNIASNDMYKKEIESYKAKYRPAFEQLSATKKLSDDGLENYLVDLYSIIISNQASLEEVTTGNNFNRQNTHYNEMGDKQSDYKLGTLKEQVNSHQAIMTGASNIEIAASKNAGLALVQQMYMLIGEDEVLFNYSDSDKSAVDPRDFVKNGRDVKGNKINLSIASILAQAVDNIKNPITETINYYPNLLNNHIFLYMIGLDPEVVDRLFTWGRKPGPSLNIDQLVKDGFQKNGLITNPFVEYIESVKKQNDDRLPEEYYGLMENGKIDFSKLKSIIYSDTSSTKSGDEKFNEIMSLNGITPEAVVYMLSKIEYDNKKTGSFIASINLIDKGLGSNLDEVLKNKMMIERVLSDLKSEKPYLNPSVNTSYVIKKLNDLIVASSESLSKLGFNVDQEEFKELVEHFEKKNNNGSVDKHLGNIFIQYNSLQYLFKKLEVQEDASTISSYFIEIQDDIVNIETIFKSLNSEEFSTYVKDENGNFVKTVLKSNTSDLKLLSSIIKIKTGVKQDFIPNDNEKLKIMRVMHVNSMHSAFNSTYSPMKIVTNMSYNSDTYLKYGEEYMSFKKFVSTLYKINEFQTLLLRKESRKELSNAFSKLFLDNLIVQDANDVYNVMSGPSNLYIGSEENRENLFFTIVSNNPELSRTFTTIVKPKDANFIKAVVGGKKVSLFKDYTIDDKNVTTIDAVRLQLLSTKIDENSKLLINNLVITLAFDEKSNKKPKALLEIEGIYGKKDVNNKNDVTYVFVKIEEGEKEERKKEVRYLYKGIRYNKPFSQALNYSQFMLAKPISTIDTVEEAEVVESGVNEETASERNFNTVNINLQPDNREKIVSGKKTTTIRTEKEFEYIGLPVGSTANTIINGVEFNVTNRGLFSIDEVEKENILASEGLESPEDFKFPTSKKWFDGKGKLYIYDFQRVPKESSVNNNIILNKDQEIALNELLEFAKDSERKTHSLIGYAGTGKTTLINIFKNSIDLPLNKIVFTSPTHRANSVIRLKSEDAIVYTLHQLLGLNIEQNLEIFDSKKAKFTPQNLMKADYGDFVIIDESSMINDDLFNLINTYLGQMGVKILYVGDDAQIKPVKQFHKSKALTSTEKQSNLTIVERANNNSLLNESMTVRNKGDFSYKSNIENNKGIQFFNNKTEFLTKALEMFKSSEFKSNSLLLRVLAGTNKEVEDTNYKIRQAIFGKDSKQFEEGDIIMGYNNWKVDYKTKLPLLNNGGDYIILNSSESSNSINGIKVNGYNVEIKNLLNKDSKSFKAFILDKNTPVDVLEQIGEEYEKIRLEAISKPKGSKEAARLWDQLSKFKDSFISTVDISYKGDVKINKSLDYGYAHTIHKSQGGTYKYSFIMADTVDNFKDDELKSQLRYVAVTRAENASFILTSNPITTTNEVATDNTNNNFPTNQVPPCI